MHVYRLLMYCFAREFSLHLRLVALPSPESLGNCNLVPTLEWNQQHSTFVFMRELCYRCTIYRGFFATWDAIALDSNIVACHVSEGRH